MVKTRSQQAKINNSENAKMDEYSDNESECSMPDAGSCHERQITDFDNRDLINRGNVNSQNSVDQRFLEKNKQISDLTSLVLALSKKISSSNREGMVCKPQLIHMIPVPTTCNFLHVKVY